MTTTLAKHCGHCGRDGTLISVKDVVLDSRTQDAWDNQPEVDVQTIVEVARCTECRRPTFTQYVWVDPFFDSPDDAQNVVRLFPPDRDVSDLPATVRDRYVAMLELLHAADVFAVRAGVCLEAVCRAQGVPSSVGVLDHRLKELVVRGDLPEALAAQAHLVRKYRNFGGHDGDVAPAAGDVPLIRDFVEALLEFFYWGPAKLKRGNDALASRVAAAKEDA